MKKIDDIINTVDWFLRGRVTGIGPGINFTTIPFQGKLQVMYSGGGIPRSIPPGDINIYLKLTGNLRGGI